MDNITHTLAGMALAEAGLKRNTRLGTATLILAANLPDLDGLSYFFGSGIAGLSFRRGWTHGVLAMALLPVLLMLALLGWRRCFDKREGVRAGWLLALAAIGIWSHPLLDLLNTYGVRLLMPFSSRWFYGDALFIVDPWLWLLLGFGTALSRRRARRPQADSRYLARPAQIALALSACYALLMGLGSRHGAAVVEQQARGGPARRVLVAPGFANPLRRDVIREVGTSYELGRLSLGLRWRYVPLAIRSSGAADPGAEAAARTRAGAAFLRWARFPVFESVRVGDSIRVTISDARYAGAGNRSWASITVRVFGEAPQAP
jgi:inner membrane protein